MFFIYFFLSLTVYPSNFSCYKNCCRVSFEFQHNVCGRSIYAEGTVDAVIFLAKKVLIPAFSLPFLSCYCKHYIIPDLELIQWNGMQIEAKDQKRVYNMIDVLREGNMR
jgi:4-hydroxy-tetrahydrodipicolinate reductase